MTASAAVYEVPDSFKNLPRKVVTNQTFTQAYIDKHKTANSTLTPQMLSIKSFVLK